MRATRPHSQGICFCHPSFQGENKKVKRRAQTLQFVRKKNVALDHDMGVFCPLLREDILPHGVRHPGRRFTAAFVAVAIQPLPLVSPVRSPACVRQLNTRSGTELSVHFTRRNKKDGSQGGLSEDNYGTALTTKTSRPCQCRPMPPTPPLSAPCF